MISIFAIFNFINFIPSYFIYFIFYLKFQYYVFGNLSVFPPDILFLDEDWPIEKLLDVKICSDSELIKNPLDLRLSNAKNNEKENNNNKLPFDIFKLNESCFGLILNKELDIILPINNKEVNNNNNYYLNNSSSPFQLSYSLLFEDLNTNERAILQIEVIDVNDNIPLFLGGPFPLELIIKSDSPPGYLLCNLEVLDLDQGIGGIVKFSLKSENNNETLIKQLFSLNSPLCQWPKCSVQLKLRQSIFEEKKEIIYILARDGAGITHKRSNTAEIKINILFVNNLLNNNNKKEEEEEDNNKFKKDNSNIQNNNNSEEFISNNTTIKLNKEELNTTNVPLITFLKRKHLNELKTTTNNNIINKEIPKIYNIESLNEDSPIGLELLNIPLPLNNSIQLIQLNKNNYLKMLPNGTIKISKTLNSELTPILKAEIKINKENIILAKINIKINSIINKFNNWIENEFKNNNENGTIIIKLNKYLNNNNIKILLIPKEFEKYLIFDKKEENDLLELKGNELILNIKNSINFKNIHCGILKLFFREKSEFKNICVEIPKENNNNNQIKILWPLNNSIHSFPENKELPALLAIITDNPSFVNYSINNNFKDGNKFLINSINGKLYYNEYLLNNNNNISLFDYEHQNIYLILINICSINLNNNCLNLFLKIQILDENDNCPIFNFLETEENKKELNIEIKEYLNKNIPIIQFPKAIDLDGSKEQKSICYKLINNYFDILISEKPEIYLIKDLKKEEYKLYKLQILVNDCPNIKQKCYKKELLINNNILIINLNINNNLPKFIFKHYFAGLINTNNKEPFLQLKAENKDKKYKNNLKYVFGEGLIIQSLGEPISMADIPFKLNYSTGELSIKEDFNLDKIIPKSYTFKVRVYDNNNQNEDQATVTVSLLNPNENILELNMFRNNNNYLDLGQLENILSLIIQNNNNLIKYLPIYRLFQSGKENCTILNIYFLDNLLNPINTFIGLKIIKNIFKLNNTINKLNDKFGIIKFEEKLIDNNEYSSLSSLSSSSSNNNNNYLFKIFSLKIIIFLFIIILILILPLIYCLFLLFKLIIKINSNKNKKEENNNNNKYLFNEKENNNYIPYGILKQKLRWKSNNSDDFEFPLPPPVNIYGNGTLTIPKARILPLGALSTEF